tara:strand:+ start:2813 stop:3544 length:732 start_codon:yes stop_codon:yes gene_type:complete
MKKLLITGKTSRFTKYLKIEIKKFNTVYPSKKEFNILKYEQIDKFIAKKKITHLIHIAGLSRPMNMHEKNINKSIDLNIIGTSNIVKACCNNNVKLIYFSTSYVYPGTKGNYSEEDSLKPINNYAWSKLGGEAAVHLYKNSLILRLCITDYPFVHKSAITGAFTSFIYNKDVAKVIPYILDEKGVINIGGKKREIFEFAKNFGNKKIKKVSLSKIKNFPKDSSINIKKFIKILKKNKFKKIVL